MEQPAHKLFNLELDMTSCDWLVEKVCNSESYAQNLYAALCNNQFVKNEVLPILKEEVWSCTWRYAGGIIADILGSGDYLDWYCSGIRQNDLQESYVSEGVVTEEIRKDLFKLGWIVLED